MKKLGAIFTACILINMPINQVLSAPKTDKISIQSSDEASPQFQLPEQSRFLSVDFKKTESFTSNHIQNFTDNYVALYSNDLNGARILIINEVVANEQEAMQIFLGQAKTRGNQKPEIKLYNNVKYIEGIDSKLNRRYILIQQFDKANSLVTIKSLVYLLNANNSDFCKNVNLIEPQQLVGELINFAK
ncbi:hypothetical protein H3S88_01350 [Gilliamella sp. B14448G11]|uniref:hypothetical protein n=1 Tax=unclassified Gilliamella TaxID=2685620 RepID=UPI0018DC59EA|nr:MULTISPECIES: hypothetical protein [unclassified Gilliamella]MBI0028968.1 hypothetical protein [Gilliamella sp. B14448G7]MBI0030443.1 hypothetical protein [Gilliamella sp. B14384G15]MBI0034315.1 hypothetical protein [Gilliamella sp. B14448G11]MBI0043086.1 hypothetical protein [Gilliamella sp. B14448G12]MBI0056925.1 hypothetical protein [Gilliamella sp. B14384G12]